MPVLEITSGQTIPATIPANTEVRIHAGTYTGNVRVDNGVSLISVDGPGQAHLVPSDQNTATVLGRGEQGVLLDGLKLTAATNRAAVEFTESGTGGAAFNADITIRSCEVVVPAAGCKDGFKLAQISGLVVVGNKLTGKFLEECIDCVTVEDFEIAFNEIDGISFQGLSGITVKGGSRDGVVRRNWVHHIGQDGILIGGYTDNALLYWGTTPPFEAHNIAVEENRIENIITRRPMNMIAAGSVQVARNRIDRSGNGYFTAVNLEKHTGRNWACASISLTDNSVDASNWLSVQSGSGTGLANTGNVVNGPWDYPVGPAAMEPVQPEVDVSAILALVDAGLVIESDKSDLLDQLAAKVAQGEANLEAIRAAALAL
jgi:hypothetical protein